MTDHQLRLHSLDARPDTREAFIERCKDINKANREKRIRVRYVRGPDIETVRRKPDATRLDMERQKGPPIGVVTIYQNDGEYFVGASYCDPRDKFDRHVGLFYAMHRAQPVKINEDGTFNYLALPPGCQDTAVHMVRDWKNHRKRSAA
jgi:hypothetical protein